MAVTANDVCAWGGFDIPTDAEELATLERVIAAVEELLGGQFILSDPLTPSQEQAITMQSFRLFSRMHDAAGFREFAEITTRSVAGIDPDVKALLKQRINFS